jgi:HEAT repeat protein
LLLFLLACVDPEPQFVSVRDLDKALASADTPALCAGLKMAEGDTRHAAAEKLKDYGLDASCLCERLQYDGRWDPSILGGLSGAKDEAKVGCVGTLLDDPAQPDRAALVTALLKIPAARPRLLQAAASEADPAVRAAALAVYRGTKDPAEVKTLEEILATNTDTSLRIAAAGALLGQDSAEPALRQAVVKDSAPLVRGAALASWQSVHPAVYAQVACTVLMEDTAWEVRMAALATFRGTRDPAQIQCLKDRALKEEPSPEVRAALLATLTSSPAKGAADVLCDVIPAWVKTYVKDAPPAEGDDILKAQNNRDFERSYDCAQAAARQAGSYTCAGKAYVGAFYREVGGKSGVPSCGGGSRASNEIVF